MKRIVKSIEKLCVPSEPIKFITETEVDGAEVEAVVKEIKAVLEAKPQLLCLAAPQIGLQKRVICIRFSDQIKVFLNPVLTRKAQPKFICEEYPNFPDKQFLLLRPSEVEVKYYNENLKYEDNKLLGTAAVLFDQMYQLLDGVVPTEDTSLVISIENGQKITEEAEDYEEFMQQAYEQYKLRIAEATKQYTDSITDENERKIYKNMKFTEAVVNNRVAVVDTEGAKQRAIVNQIKNNSKATQIKAEFNRYIRTHKSKK